MVQKMGNEHKEDVLWLAAIVILHAMLILFLQNSLANADRHVIPPVIVGMMIQDDAAAGAAIPKKQVATSSNKLTQDKHIAKKIDTASSTTKPSGEKAVVDSAGSAGKEGAGEGDVSLPSADAKYLNNLKPAYPSLSRRLGEEGRVLLLVHVMSDGSVHEIKIKQSSGYSRLDQSAIESVKHWRYIPANQGGKPIPYWYVQTIVFSLKTR